MQRLVIGSLLMVLWVASILLLPGCGGATEAQAAEAVKPRPLTITVVNRSGGEITQIGISGANMPIACSDMADGASSTALKNKELKLPERLTLHWSDSRGDRKEGTVNVWGELSAAYSGPITLTITRRGKVKLTGG